MTLSRCKCQKALFPLPPAAVFLCFMWFFVNVNEGRFVCQLFVDSEDMSIVLPLGSLIVDSKDRTRS